MKAIVLIDTTVLLNVLRVPGKSSSRDVVIEQLGHHIQAMDQLLLPMATVIETGNHVAQNGNGQERRRCATEFVDIVRDAATASVPWALIPLPDQDDLMSWLAGFPDSAMRRTGLGDVSIVHAFNRACEKFPYWRVTVWSLDRHLQGLDRVPNSLRS